MTARAVNLTKLADAQLGDLIARAQAQREQLAREKATKARAKIAALAKAEGYSIDELFGSKRRRRKASAKYRNPADTSQLWSGRGKRPKWFNAALAAGRKEKDLLVTA